MAAEPDDQVTKPARPLPVLVRTTGYGVTVASIAVLAMMLLASADIVGTIFRVPVDGALEIIETLMVIVIFLALPDAEMRGQQITVDLVYQRFSPRTKRVATFVSGVLALVFFGAMAWQGWKLFYESWQLGETASGLVRFHIYPSKGLFALGVTITAIVILVKLVWGVVPQGNVAKEEI